MKQLQVLRVVVASPADVQSERNSLEEVAMELNRGFAKDRGLYIEIARWETDSSPGFHEKGPQGLVDLALRIEDCDLLIGIFWKRFGTPTADAKSGTEHEFRKAYEAWECNKRPQIMIYFNEKPYSPKTREEINQWGQVIDFKSNFPKEGLWWTYAGKSKFEKLVRQHITQFILRLPVADSIPFNLQRVDNNSSNTAMLTTDHNAPSVDEQIGLWMQATGSQSKMTTRAYEGNMQQFRTILQQHDLDLNSGKVSAILALISDWAVQGKRKEDVSNNTFNQRCYILRSFYRFAYKQRWMKVNLAEMIEVRKSRNIDAAKSLNPEEVKDALKKIDRSTRMGKRDYALLCILFTTGQRVSEITGLQCSDVTRAEGRVTIATRQRGGKPMKYELKEGTAQALLDYLNAFYGIEWPADAPIWISVAWNNTKGQPLLNTGISDVCKRHLSTPKVETTRLTYLAMKNEVGVRGIEKLLDIH